MIQCKTLFRLGMILGITAGGLLGEAAGAEQGSSPGPSFVDRFHYRVESPRASLSDNLSSFLIPSATAGAPGFQAVPADAPNSPEPAPSRADHNSQAVSAPHVSRPKRISTGRAAFYEHPGRTASGERYNPDGLTAAHRSLPLGSRVKVVNLGNGRSVVVRINDRAPPRGRHVIDLSRGSARAIGITRVKGVGNVAIYAMD